MISGAVRESAHPTMIANDAGPDHAADLIRERIIEQPARMPRDHPPFRIITRVRKCLQKSSQRFLVHAKSILRRALRIVLGRLDTAKTEVICASRPE